MISHTSPFYELSIPRPVLGKVAGRVILQQNRYLNTNHASSESGKCCDPSQEIDVHQQKKVGVVEIRFAGLLLPKGITARFRAT